MEALRLEPNHHSARVGICESIKARNPLYRSFVAYANWLSRLSDGMQIAFFVGIWFGMKVVRGVAQTNPALAPVGYAALGLYLFFIYTTWTAQALFNVMLFLHPIGRHALSDYERRVTLAMVGTIAGGITLALCGLATGHIALYAAAAATIGIGIPLAALYQAETRELRRFFITEVSAFALATLVLTALALFLPEAISLFSIFGVLLMLSTWLNSAKLNQER